MVNHCGFVGQSTRNSGSELTVDAGYPRYKLLVSLSPYKIVARQPLERVKLCIYFLGLSVDTNVLACDCLLIELKA